MLRVLASQAAAGWENARLLRQRSENVRLKELNQYLAAYVPRQRTIERMKELAPTNGFGGKPAGL